MCYLVLEPLWWLAVTVKASLRRWGELCAICLGAVNQIFSLPRGSEGEVSESALLYFMFTNPSSLPNRISLQEDWDVNWRSAQICYCLRIRCTIQKELQSQKLETPLYDQRQLQGHDWLQTQQWSCSVCQDLLRDAWVHPSDQLWSLLWLWTMFVPWEKLWWCWILLVLTRVEECCRTRVEGYVASLCTSFKEWI